MTRHPPATTDSAARRRSEPAPDGNDPAVRGHIHTAGGERGRALAATQGRALAALLASLGKVEVGQGEEVSP